LRGYETIWIPIPKAHSLLLLLNSIGNALITHRIYPLPRWHKNVSINPLQNYTLSILSRLLQKQDILPFLSRSTKEAAVSGTTDTLSDKKGWQKETHITGVIWWTRPQQG
jgi:hypothetical protein